MIVKCNLHASAPRLTEYLITQAGNERIEIVANHGSLFTGLTPDDVRFASKVMDIDFQKTAGKYPCYHVQISPGKNEHLTSEQIPHTIGTYLKERNLEGRSHIATVHHKPDGSMHLHMQISRFDPKTGKLDKNKMWREDHDRIRAKLEDDFDHAPTPKKNPRRAEIKRQMTYLYSTSKTPQDFILGVNKLGYVLAYGGNRSHPWQIVDSKAVGHNLNSLIQIGKGEDKRKVTTKQMIDHMKGIRFPTLNEAIQMQRTKSELYNLELKRAQEEAIRAEQFGSPPAKPRVRVEVGKPAEVKKPDTSQYELPLTVKEPPKKEVGELDISKKQDAFTAAINQFREKEAADEKPVFPSTEEFKPLKKIETERSTAVDGNPAAAEMGFPITNKQDAWVKAIEQHKNQGAISKKQEGAIKAVNQFKRTELTDAFVEQRKDVVKTEAERLAEERARKIREMEAEIEEKLNRGRNRGVSM